MSTGPMSTAPGLPKPMQSQLFGGLAGLAFDPAPLGQLAAAKPVLGAHLGGERSAAQHPAEYGAAAPMQVDTPSQFGRPALPNVGCVSQPPMGRRVAAGVRMDDDSPAPTFKSIDEIPSICESGPADAGLGFRASQLKAPSFDDEIDDEALAAEELAFLQRMKGGKPDAPPLAEPARPVAGLDTLTAHTSVPKLAESLAMPSHQTPNEGGRCPVAISNGREAANYLGPTLVDNHDVDDDLSEEELEL